MIRCSGTRFHETGVQRPVEIDLVVKPRHFDARIAFDYAPGARWQSGTPQCTGECVNVARKFRIIRQLLMADVSSRQLPTGLSAPDPRIFCQLEAVARLNLVGPRLALA